MTRAWYAFGQHVEIACEDARLFRLLAQRLPVFPAASGHRRPDVRYQVTRMGSSLALLRHRRTVAITGDITTTSERLVADLQAFLARRSPDGVFVHAGVVAIGDSALLLPGRSWAGKSTLVSALLRVGAAYASDELAVVDADGFVQPFARPLALRTPESGVTHVALRDIDAHIVTNRMPVRAVVFTEFRAGAMTELHRLGTARTALQLLEHCLGARARPRHSLRALSAIAHQATGFTGLRGDADACALELIGRARAGWC